MNTLAAGDPKCAYARLRFHFGVALLLGLYIAACCLSLTYAADSFPGIVQIEKSHVPVAIMSVSIFSAVSILFVMSRFSFGYLLGFYFYTIILGYVWLGQFSLLSYNHPLAMVSIFLSAIAFLTPALFITSAIRQRVILSDQTLNFLLSLILILAAAVIAVGASYNFRLVNLGEIYKYRGQIEFPAVLRYAIGLTSNALLPFAFACYVMRKQPSRAGIALLLLLLFYPITLTRMTLFAPFWLLFLTLLSKWFEARTAVIFSLFLPMSVGVILLLLTKAGAIAGGLGFLYFGTVNSRMIAMPSIGLEVYNNFFSNHELTHFCQINVLKPFTNCPYSEELSAIMAKVYEQGAFNASLFATEGIASVGPKLAPLSALGCGLVIALANRLSSGLPSQFVLLSGGVLPQIFLNVPLSTTLLSNGAILLFLLWYLTPRSIFEKDRVACSTASTGGNLSRSENHHPAMVVSRLE
jgi:hypothetical protein